MEIINRVHAHTTFSAKERLWAQDEFVEFDKSLNTAIQTICQALSLVESPT